MLATRRWRSVHCPECGKVIVQGDTQCVSCGRAVDGEPRLESGGPKKNERWLLGLFMGLAAVVLLSVVGYGVLGSSASGKGKPDTGDRIVFENDQVIEASRPEDRRDLDIQIKGFNCPTCSNGVKSALLKNQGILAAEIEQKGRARITFDGTHTSKDEILKSIEDQGYETVVFE